MLIDKETIDELGAENQIKTLMQKALSLKEQEDEFGKQEMLKGMEEHYKAHLKYIISSLKEKIEENLSKKEKWYIEWLREEEDKETRTSIQTALNIVGEFDKDIKKIFQEMGE
jgi:predicted phosphoadenosine phosphosulfate sulfurtransferase